MVVFIPGTCRPPPPPRAVLRGLLICVKLLSYLGLEDYTVQAPDSSHWEDVSLLDVTRRREAVVMGEDCRVCLSQAETTAETFANRVTQSLLMPFFGHPLCRSN